LVTLLNFVFYRENTDMYYLKERKDWWQLNAINKWQLNLQIYVVCLCHCLFKIYKSW
jgi:hypothetical protein